MKPDFGIMDTLLFSSLCQSQLDLMHPSRTIQLLHNGPLNFMHISNIVLGPFFHTPYTLSLPSSIFLHLIA
jgi:hypothetical protein